MKKIIDCTTGQITERELTTEEIAEQEIDAANSLAEKAEQQAEAEAKAAAKVAAQAKLATLGLTVEDLQALGLGGN